jgi:hypothetical protein
MNKVTPSYEMTASKDGSTLFDFEKSSDESLTSTNSVATDLSTELQAYYDELDKLVDQRNISYHEAKRLVSPPAGYEEYTVGKTQHSEPIEVKPDSSTEKPPIAVRLDDRLVALEGIVGAFNQAGKLRGAEQSRYKIDERYGDNAGDVMQGMHSKQERLYRKVGHHLGVLVAEDALRAHGFSQEVINKHKSILFAKLNNQYGPDSGNYAPERKKRIIAPATKTVKHLRKKGVLPPEK